VARPRHVWRGLDSLDVCEHVDSWPAVGGPDVVTHGELVPGSFPIDARQRPASSASNVSCFDSPSRRRGWSAGNRGSRFRAGPPRRSSDRSTCPRRRPCRTTRRCRGGSSTTPGPSRSRRRSREPGPPARRPALVGLGCCVLVDHPCHEVASVSRDTPQSKVCACGQRRRRTPSRRKVATGRRTGNRIG
jgi:hypothetical protein